MKVMAPEATGSMLTRRSVLLASAGLVVFPFGISRAQTLQPLNQNLSGDLYPVHDPCIIKGGDTFYVFCTTPRADGAWRPGTSEGAVP